MHRALGSRQASMAAVATLVLLFAGCTNPYEYVRNGFKVGPNYCTVAAPVANNWIDAADVRIRSQSDDISQWWNVFNDPVLNNLIACAYRQNLTVKQAAFRVLQSRYQLAITRGEFFPQQQFASGSYSRAGSGATGFFDNWNCNFNLQWELDIWGRLRRAIQAADDQLGASVADYDDVMVTLLSDVASNYVQIRTDQELIKLLNENVQVQTSVYALTQTRLGVGTLAELDVQQAESTLKQTEAAIPLVLIDMRQANDQLCTLLGIPPADLMKMLGNAPIPIAPPEVALGIPCEMLRRRPDIRRAERLAAAQAEQIGIAETDLYPIFSIGGNMGWSANNLPELFTPQAFNGNVGPSFNWKLLNYGRIVNNVHFQDANFQQLIAAYQNTVLVANQEVENGLVTFLQAQERTKILNDSVKAGEIARGITLRLYETGQTGFDFNRYALIEQNLITQQNAWASARGQIAQGLISVYRALGGGWEIRLNPPPAPEICLPVTPPPDVQQPGVPVPGAVPMPEILPTPSNPTSNPYNPPQQLPPKPPDISTTLPSEPRRAT
jgi:NodT family efflux transporter outer membrane factor (OMF) lipoprotein